MTWHPLFPIQDVLARSYVTNYKIKGQSGDRGSQQDRELESEYQPTILAMASL